MQTSIFFISEISDQKFQIFSKIKTFSSFSRNSLFIYLFFVKLEEFSKNISLFDLKYKKFLTLNTVSDARNVVSDIETCIDG
jgi:hypothetical protein